LTVLDAIKLVEGATNPARLLGSEPARRYKEFARLLHPDTTPAKTRDRAIAAFRRLTELYELLNGKQADIIIGKWKIEGPLAKGDIADLHYATELKVKSTDRFAFKIARSEDDNDLLEAEYVHLGILHKANGIKNFSKYLPSAAASLEASGRRANVLTLAPDAYTLAHLLALYPQGLDFRHIVWAMNRSLNALGFAHGAGIVHGAVIPEHLMFGPVSHGLTLVDWCYSVTAESKAHVPARVIARADLYPPEVEARKPALPQTDIYMLAKTMKLAAKSIPPRFKPIFDHCLAESPKSRPTECWKLVDRWAELAAEEYGKPTYVKLEVPVS
jgi:hypothetical protein